MMYDPFFTGFTPVKYNMPKNYFNYRPFARNPYYSATQNCYSNMQQKKHQPGYTTNNQNMHNNNYSYKNKKYNNCSNTHQINQHINNLESVCTDSSTEEEKPIFELFGIKLFFDDILIICLIFFLFQEGVKDQYLFISLILLLLS